MLFAFNACADVRVVTKIKPVYMSVPAALLAPEAVQLQKARTNKEVIESFLRTLTALKKCNAKLKAIKRLQKD